MDKYKYYCKPKMTEMLEYLNLNISYLRAKGNKLWYKNDKKIVEVLDLVGGYGANLLGHNHPDLIKEYSNLLSEHLPNLVQGSNRKAAAELAEILCDHTGDYIITFTNSGTETVEAAIKHAYLRKGKNIFWAVKGAFHGKTLGAVQLTWSFKEKFNRFGPEVRFIDPENEDQWKLEEQYAANVSGIFFEPILGEGGIKPLSKRFAEWIRKTCSQNQIPIIADEIQTGLGRCGSFLASQVLNIDPDYICLSKALGGGMVKIGALLIKREQFIDEFSMMHTSTFAEDEISCRIAIKVMEIIKRDHISQKCRIMGEYLFTELKKLEQRYPGIIKDVRGMGLMIGIEFQDMKNSESNSLMALSNNKILLGLISGYCFKEFKLRIAPTLNQTSTIRIEPSAYISKEEIDLLISALLDICEILERADTAQLIGTINDLNPSKKTDRGSAFNFKREIHESTNRVAFIGHFILPEHIKLWDSSFEKMSTSDVEKIMNKYSKIFEPQIYDRVNVRSITGDIVHLSFIGLFISSKLIENCFRNRNYQWIVEKIERGIELAKENGCSIAGLGGYTSILTGNCRKVKIDKIALTSGNSLTCGMGIEALKSAANEKGIELNKSVLGVVGANGNIAKTYAMILAPHVSEIVLIVRDLASPAINKLLDDFQSLVPSSKMTIFDNLNVLKRCNLIVSASNSASSILKPEHLSLHPTVICDISVPSDVSDSVCEKRPDIKVIKGGIIRLPLNDDFLIGGIPLEKGNIYACMAETLLMGLENKKDHGSYGPISINDVNDALMMANKHGFGLECLKEERSF